jgi:hypothetical protein
VGDFHVKDIRTWLHFAIGILECWNIWNGGFKGIFAIFQYSIVPE